MSKKPVFHPGKILRREYLEPLDLSAGALARCMNVPRTRVERIVDEQIGVTVDTALRLARALGTSPQFWLDLQREYELAIAERALSKELATIEPIKQRRKK
jgi:addiction module HigA family antidote